MNSTQLCKLPSALSVYNKYLCDKSGNTQGGVLSVIKERLSCIEGVAHFLACIIQD